MSMSRSETTASNSTGFLLDGRWRIRPDINRIYDGEIEHQIPDKFMQVLMVLVDREGVVSRQELFELVWPDTLVVDESLTRAISSLRKVLDDDPKNPRIIETIPKKGYRLVSTVEPLGVELEIPEIQDGDRRRPKRARHLLVWAVIAVAALAFAAWWITARMGSQRTEEASRLQLTALPGIEEYPALSPAGDRVTFIWDGNGEEPDGVFVQVIGAGPPLRITHTPGHYAHPAWTHDSRHIAFVRHTGELPGIFMAPASGGAEIELVAADQGILLNSPAFSPDGRWLAFAQRDLDGGHWQIHRKDLETGDREILAPSQLVSHGGYRPRFSPNGRHLAFFRIDHGGREIVIIPVDGSKPMKLVTGDEPVADFDWAPDGLGMVISRGGDLELVRNDGTQRTVLSGAGSIGVVSVAEQQPLLAYSLGNREKNIWQWTPPTDLANEERKRLVHTTAWDAFPTLSPDGRSMAFLSDRTGTPQLWLSARDGTDQHALTGAEDATWSPIAWSPDSTRIALSVVIDGIPVTRIVEVAGGTQMVLPPPEGGENIAGWSTDSDSIYVSRPAPEGEEVWRRSTHPQQSSEAVPITSGGGVVAIEAPDGSSLYFTRSLQSREIWRCELDGSSAKPVFSLDTGEILAWGVTERGLVFAHRDGVGDRTYNVAFFDFDSHTTNELFTTSGRLGLNLDVDHRDGRTIVFDQTEAIDSDIFAVVNY